MSNHKCPDIDQCETSMGCLRLEADCVGGIPCTTCPDKSQCGKTGCMRLPECIGPPTSLMTVIQQIRFGIEANRCDGESAYAMGVNAARENHLMLIDHLLAEHAARPGVE